MAGVSENLYSCLGNQHDSISKLGIHLPQNPGHETKGRSTIPHGNLFNYVHSSYSSFICKNQKLETVLISLKIRVNKKCDSFTQWSITQLFKNNHITKFAGKGRNQKKKLS